MMTQVGLACGDVGDKHLPGPSWGLCPEPPQHPTMAKSWGTGGL